MWVNVIQSLPEQLFSVPPVEEHGAVLNLCTRNPVFASGMNKAIDIQI